MRPPPRAAARGAGRTRTSRPPSSSESTAPSGSRGSGQTRTARSPRTPRTVRTAATPPARRGPASPAQRAARAQTSPRPPVFDQGATSEVTKTMGAPRFVSFRFVTDEGETAGIAGVSLAGESSDDAPPTAETTLLVFHGVPGLGFRRRPRRLVPGAVVSFAFGIHHARAFVRAPRPQSRWARRRSGRARRRR